MPEAGSRTKIAIYSRNENVDPGEHVGQRGSRIRAIVDELRGEMIDVIKWSSNAEEHIAASLSPAKVLQVSLDEENKVARVVVPDSSFHWPLARKGRTPDLQRSYRLENRYKSELT